VPERRRAVEPRLDHGECITRTLEPTISWGGHRPKANHVATTRPDPPGRREQSVQKLLSYPLRKEGYEVVPAMDGQEALERCRGQSFDLIVLE